MKIAYYVSNHGYGHISRSFELIRNLLSKPNTQVVLNTTREKFLEGQTFPNLSIRAVNTDLGVAQNSSIQIDLEATEKSIRDFRDQFLDLLAQERRFLLDFKPDLILSDSSSFPFVLSNELKIPSIFLGNFTWDFIYENYRNYSPIFVEYSKELAEQYSLADLGLILPFACPIKSVGNQEPIGLIGRSPRRERNEIRKELNFSDSKTYILFSFGAYGLSDSDFDFSNLPPEYSIVISRLSGFRNERVIAFDDIYYPDLLSACDLVITKPGYGILAESYLAGTPILYTERGDFAEYPYLVESMKDYHNAIYLSNTNLYNCNFKEAVESVLKKKSEKRKILKDGISEVLLKIFNLK
ncbi:MAG: hypothetical protein H7A24_08580 [Leptospiraceae bacterium]|nr:hypothetical protein [Leptospiraceae bacterium]MCP5511922.1 hypothetical protein [Leptospiraceae bacterium]